MLFLKILQLIILIAAALYAVMMVFTLITGVPVIPAHRRVQKVIAKIITDHIKDKKNIKAVELGAGYGGQVLYLARTLPKIKFTAYELNPVPWPILKLRAKLAGQKNLNLKQQNFFKDDLSQFDVLLCYLSPPLMPKLQQKLKNGTYLLISYTLPLPGIKPFKVVTVRGWIFPSKLYVYRLKPQ